jgi:hypothetical protein
MITLKQFMEVVDYRITEGSEYGWNCYGGKAYCLSSWNGEHDGHSLSIIFDTEFQTVYEVQAHDYRNNRAYRLIHPDCVEDYRNEAAERDVPADEAWDDVNYVDLETEEDWLEKARAIVAGEDYDTRVSIPVNMPDDALFTLMKQAHELDITLNQHLENIIRAEIVRLKEEQNLSELIESLEEDVHETNTDDPIDFPVPKKKKKGKK